MKRTRGNDCEGRIEEVIACVAGEASLSAEAAAHLRECAECGEKLAELKAVAAMHEQGAARIPEPRRRLKRRELERLMAEDAGGKIYAEFTENAEAAESGKSWQNRPRQVSPAFNRIQDAGFRWLRLVVAGGAVAVMLLVAAVVMRREVPVESTQVPKVENREATGAVEGDTFVPTMLALHHEVQGGSDRFAAATGVGSGMTHYRVGDVASELASFSE